MQTIIFFQSPLPSPLPTAAAGGLPDLIPAGHRDRVDRYTAAINPADPHQASIDYQSNIGRVTIII